MPSACADRSPLLTASTSVPSTRTPLFSGAC